MSTLNENSGPELNSGSLAEVFRVALPLILVASGNSVKLFCDRAMLSHFSNNQMEAAFTSGITYFTLLVFFIAIVSYCNIFVSQYYGAGEYDRVGIVVWQGVFISVAAGALLGTGLLWAEPLFALLGRDQSMQLDQVRYVKILFAASVFPLMMVAFTSFWGGLGRTWMVLLIEFSTVVINIILNYMLIFGNWGCPPLGIVGAAYGTVVSTFIGTVFAFLIFISAENRKVFNTLPDRVFHFEIIKKILKFGVENGVRAVLDVGAFNVFVIILSYYGTLTGQASTITFTVNALAFIPLFGIGNSISILVGQGIGSKNIELAQRVVKSGAAILTIYLTVSFLLLTVFNFIPLALFNINSDLLRSTTSKYMFFVAVELVFNGIAILYSSAISGAGDTNYPMKLTLYISWGVFALPLIVIYLSGLSSTFAWLVFVFHVIPKAVILYYRYRSGLWENMKVI